MEKRKLSAIPREAATEDMMEMAGSICGVKHIVTARLVEESKILLLSFYEVGSLRKRKTDAVFRTFFSQDDYITQDLSVSKVKWRTASLYMMDNVTLWNMKWNSRKKSYDVIDTIVIRSDAERRLIIDFFKEYAGRNDRSIPWSAVASFQNAVKARKLEMKHKKETDPIDALMEPIKEPPEEFFDWVWEKGMSFSRYLIYRETKKGKAECECTYCKKTGIVDRNTIRLRNNEKGKCPFCGSSVTFKARGKLAARNTDERWFVYVDPTENGFIFRYFRAVRTMRSDGYLQMLIKKERINQEIWECRRVFYTFLNDMPVCTSYDWGVYKQMGKERWCPDQGKTACMQCILYPDNLPQAWEHTPMKYSGLEYLSRNAPTTSCRYEDAIKGYIKYPKLEWICKMGLSNLAFHLIQYECRGYAGSVGKVRLNADTIYEILGLNKVNTRVLQEIDGGTYHLRLLQAAQKIGLNFKPEQLREYYDVFECNTELLKPENRKASLHKIVKYISKESENYPIGETGRCWKYSYMRYTERKDMRIERKRNCAHDWLEYIGWCKDLKYDLDNMFIYMPKNFKKVHDRTAQEYQALQDKKAAAEKKQQETLARKRMEKMQKCMEDLFQKNDGTDAFAVKGNGLVLIVPKNGDEIRREGEALHHCVGSYVEKVARGETNIFFVRKAKEQDKPYFTMEFRDNNIVQCRGSHNCGMPPEVEAFVKVFESKMQEEALGKN